MTTLFDKDIVCKEYFGGCNSMFEVFFKNGLASVLSCRRENVDKKLMVIVYLDFRLNVK